jgi:hypothetical protein
MTPSIRNRREKWAAPDTAEWAAKVCSELERSLSEHKALPRRKDHWILGYLGLLLVHMTHLSLAILRLSDLATNRRATKRFQTALADVAALTERVASISGRIAPPTQRLGTRHTTEEAQVDAQLRTLALEVRAMTYNAATASRRSRGKAPIARGL